MRFASLLLFLIPAICGVEPAQVIGLVTFIQGRWVDNVKPDVHYGYAVWSTSRLHISAPPEVSDEIKVRSYMNGQLISFKCISLPCENPHDLGPVMYEEKGTSPSGSLFSSVACGCHGCSAFGRGQDVGVLRARVVEGCGAIADLLHCLLHCGGTGVSTMLTIRPCLWAAASNCRASKMLYAHGFST